MATTLLTDFGTLNRALTSVSVVGAPELNVTSGFFANKVARISFEGDTADYIPALAGAVPSPRLYQTMTCTFYILKSQLLAALWETRRQLNPVIGAVVVVTDSPTLEPYNMLNCVLANISDLNLSGDDNDFPVMIRGSLPISLGLQGATAAASQGSAL